MEACNGASAGGTRRKDGLGRRSTRCEDVCRSVERPRVRSRSARGLGETSRDDWRKTS